MNHSCLLPLQREGNLVASQPTISYWFGMRISNAASVNVFVAVTACGADSNPCACRTVALVVAHHDAVPVVVMVPSVIAIDVTLRPFGEPAAGAPKALPVPQDLNPSKPVVEAIA